MAESYLNSFASKLMPAGLSMPGTWIGREGRTEGGRRWEGGGGQREGGRG